MKRTPSLLVHAAVIGFFALVALIVTYPLVLHAADQFPGFVYGDANEMAHHIWWFGYALRHGEPLFYQSLLAYPTGIDGVTLWANPLQFFPASALALFLPLPLALNLQVWATMALNGWAMWLLAQYLMVTTIGVWRAKPAAHDPLVPALLAGLVFMLFPTMQGHLGAGHAGLMVQWGVPLYAYGLFRLAEAAKLNTPRRPIGLIGLTALAFLISAAGHSLQVIYVVLPLTGLFALALFVRKQWRGLTYTVIAAGIGALALGLFLLPSIRATLGTTAYTDEGGVVRYSADVLAVVTPSFLHPLFGRLDYTHQVLGINLDEGAAYVGVIAALLGVIAAWRIKAARWWLLVAVVAIVLSLGPLLKWMDQPVSFQFEGYRSYVTLPFALIADLPFIKLARTPGRFNFLTALAVAALAGYGGAWLWSRLQRIPQAVRAIGFVGLMVVIGFEYQTFFPLPITPAAVPQAVSDLAAREEIRAVLDLPWENLVTAKDGLYLQTAHQHALIAGQVSRRTPVDPALLTVLESTLDPALLDTVGADVIIVHREQDTDGTIEARARERLGDPFYEDVQYALFNRPGVAGSQTLPGFAVVPGAQTADESTVYAFAPVSGWIDAQITLADAVRPANLYVDGRRMFTWSSAPTTDTALQIWLPNRGFHTLRLASADPCPQIFDPSLVCPPTGDLTLDRGFMADESAPSAALDHGIGLASARMDYLVGRAVHVYLTWIFDQPLTDHDVSYVHIIDANGNPILQEDRPLGNFAAGDGQQDQVYLYRSGFAPGEYRVYVGWYHLSDDGTLRNYPIVGSAPEGSTGQDILVGSFTAE